jgi:Protein of unknown function (DUF1566)
MAGRYALSGCGGVYGGSTAGCRVTRLRRFLPGGWVEGPALDYQDNGNGTTTDLNTKLMWEQKLPATDPACTAATPSVHCVNNVYTWSATEGGTEPDGTAFTVFLDALNNKCDGNGTTPCTRAKDCKGSGSGKRGFTGRRDWRIPNVRELQSIVNYGLVNPAIDPTTFPGGFAAVDGYWSNTERWEHYPLTNEFLAPVAWYVDFFDGSVSSKVKSWAYRLRAVRGGAQTTLGVLLGE